VSLIKSVKSTSKKVRANRRNGRKHLPKSNGQALPIGQDPGEPGRAAAGHENPLKGEGPHLEGASLGQPAQPAAGATAQPASKVDLEAIVRSLEGVLDDSVCPRPIRLALAAMEEESAQFARLHQELIDEWQPSTPPAQARAASGLLDVAAGASPVRPGRHDGIPHGEGNVRPRPAQARRRQHSTPRGPPSLRSVPSRRCVVSRQPPYEKGTARAREVAFSL
jgi:hypothetical protein